MKDWWKAPVLQGDDNEYGKYDYMIEELPRDYARWELDKYAWKCDNCGKDSRLLFRSVSHFYTLDGYDYHSWSECWKCRLKTRIGSVKYKIKKKINIFKETLILHHNTKSLGWKECYKLAARLVK